MTDPLADLLDHAAPAAPAPRLPAAEQHAIATLARAGLDPVVVDYTTRSKDGTITSARVEVTPDSAAQGTVPIFVERPEDDQEPPSMLGYVGELLHAYDGSRPRSQQKRPGPSEIGTPCGRQLAYKIAEERGADITRHNLDDFKWAALQGTMIHELMERALAYDNERNAADPGFDPWDIEAEARVDDRIRGSSDAFKRVTVVDWKYTGTTALNKLRAAKRRGAPPRDQISQDYRIQAHLYGEARRRRGLPVKWVRLILLARSHDFTESEEWTERFNPDLAQWAIDRYYRLDELVDTLNPIEHPERWAEIPDSPGEAACHWCPFKRPGAPADDTGCPGNTAQVAETSRARFERGLGFAAR